MLEKYDRTINIAGMLCLIRFIPSFVKRYKKWDTEIRHSSLCPFCDVGETSNKTQFSTFKYLENDFPFMLNQFTIFCAKHKEFLNCNELEYALDLINKSCVLKSGSLQIQGSGASIPEHAHFSVSSEVYPITMLKRKIFVESKNYNIEQILGIPHLAIVISGSISHISRITNKILSNIIVDTRIHATSQLAGFAKQQDLAFFAKAVGNMSYEHREDCAPTKELLAKYQNDQISWQEYSVEYLNLLDMRQIVQKIPPETLHQHCLLCSEHTPEQCHRRLLAEYFQAVRKDVQIIHLY